MILIQKQEDFKKCEIKHIHPLIIKYLKNYLDLFLQRYQCNEISEFGAFYLFENYTDCKNYKKMGLYAPLNKTPCEFTEIITIKDNSNKLVILHSCFLISDNYAISVFMPNETLDNLTKEHLSKNAVEIEVSINV